jgi:hypothetical protein
VVVVRKSLSTHLKQICLGNNFQTGNIDQNKRRKYLVVLRDPLQRWYASVHWYIRNHGLDKNDLHPSLVDFWFNNVCWDDHTLPQYCYLTGVPSLSQIIAVDFAPGMFAMIQKIFDSFGYGCDTPTETPLRQGHQFNLDKFDDPLLIEKIQNFYNQDYWLRHWLLETPVPDKILALKEDL